MKKQDKRHVEADHEQMNNAYDLAQARRKAAEAKSVADEARDNLIGSLGDDPNAIVVDKAGRIIFESSESIQSGSIDWKKFMEDNPGLDFEKYRKPVKSVITIKTGPMIEAIVENIAVKENVKDDNSQASE